MLLPSLAANQLTVVAEHHAFALRAVGVQDWVKAVNTEKDHCAGADLCHFCNHRIGCVEYRATMRCHVLNDDSLEQGKCVNGIDKVHAEMVTHADIGDNCDIAAVKG